MIWLIGLALLVIPPITYAFVRFMSRASERFRGHMTGWIIMSFLNGIGLGGLAFGWVWMYAELLDALAVSRLWLLLPFGLLLVAGIVYVVILGRRLGRPSADRTDSLKPESTMPDRGTLVRDLHDQLRNVELTERRTEEDIRRLEAELTITEQASDGPAKRLAIETLTKRLAWQREDMEFTQRRRLEVQARLSTIEGERAS